MPIENHSQIRHANSRKGSGTSDHAIFVLKQHRHPQPFFVLSTFLSTHDKKLSPKNVAMINVVFRGRANNNYNDFIRLQAGK